MTKRDFIKEHTFLVALLKRVGKKFKAGELIKEANKQNKELTEVRKGKHE